MVDRLHGIRRRRFAFSVCALFIMFAAGWSLTLKAQQATPAKVSTLRLYVLDLGGRPPGPAESCYPAYLVVHPSGRTLLFEAGGLPDAYVDPSKPRTDLREALRTIVQARPLKEKLADVGYTPAQITFFALSHYHDDHTGNANMFAGSTWLVQKNERDAMFADPPPPIANPATYDALKNSKTVVIENKNYDVFGDGSAMLIFTPGHTPGGQALYLKLARTGGVVLSGDIYHNTGEHVAPFDKVPALDTNKELTVPSRVALEDFLKKNNATLWIHHDVPTFKTLKKSPEYYE
jgi:glyoxylase-like metal-dependent hydrolase (beta-lactamase superfamily II)